MSKKKTKYNKIKLNNKIKLIFSIFVIIAVIIIGVVISSRKVNVGKIVDGKIEYIEKIVNVTTYPAKIIIEFNNDYEYIDNGIVTTEIYNKLKNNDPRYNITVSEYSKLKDITNKEAYNLNRALQEKIVKEDDKYHEYFAKTCGFKNKKELLKYIEAIIDLNDKL